MVCSQMNVVHNIAQTYLKFRTATLTFFLTATQLYGYYKWLLEFNATSKENFSKYMK